MARTMADVFYQYHNGAVVPLKNKLNQVLLDSASFTIPADAWILENGGYTANIAADVAGDNAAVIFFDDDSAEVVSAANISCDAETAHNVIKIFAASSPSDSICGNYFTFEEESLMGKAIIFSGQDSTFVGATSITSGVAGNVPAPLAGDQNKFLRGNGTWSTVAGGGSAEKFSVNGASVDHLTFSGDGVNFNSQTAVVSISGGGSAAADFTVNGAAAKGIFINNANYSFDTSTKVANFSVPAGITAVSIVGAGTGSISGNTLNLQFPTATTLQGANFSVSPTSLNSAAFTDATLNFSRLGDGVISPIPNPAVMVEPISATQFKLRGKKVTNTNVGFLLGETATHYGAGLNVAAEFTTNPADVILHFDNAGKLAWNSANDSELNATLTGATTADGKWGYAIKTNQANYFALPNALTGDFTFDWWQTSSTNSNNICAGTTRYLTVDYAGNTMGLIVQTPVTGTRVEKVVEVTANEFHHVAWSYDSTAHILRCFVDGVKQLELENAYFNDAPDNLQIGNGAAVDEVRVLRACAYTEDFTPPTEPY